MFQQTGFPYNLFSSPTSYTVQVADTGTNFDNTGASGNVVMTLPPATPGLTYTFASSVLGKTVQVKCSGTDTIKFAGLVAVTASTSSLTTFGCMTVTCITPGVWQVTSQVGAWT